MKRASEHREDRFSPSLHIVDANNATLFSDEGVQQTKGLSMESQQQRHDSAFSQKRVAHIRMMRRQAVRRRQILVASLLVITAVVVLLAVSMQFSPLFACIPAALAVLALVLGAKASRDARRWEQELSAATTKHVVKAVQGTRADNRNNQLNQHAEGEGLGYQRQSKEEERPQAVYMTVDELDDLASRSAADEDESATNVLAASEVHEVLRQAQQDKQRALAKREHQAENSRPADVKASESHQTASSQQGKQHSKPSQKSDTRPSTGSTSSNEAGVAQRQTPLMPQAQELPDATNELKRISPSPVLDAFEMAASQDLISFSLGEARSSVAATPAEAESLEIKSVRQVSKAVPKAAPKTVQAPASTSLTHDSHEDSSQDSADKSTTDVKHFHDSETQAEVDAPEQTSDSLGVNIESILARRSQS
ncbi:hypothetical protein [Bifidobacterium sp.]|jgi:hypothetical protein|uniref:hypothetical protein n=1 Tax=Bifidobacterium sp. TaxID=41200 RepID=UPI0025C4BD1F|nr:hypothetical protein [Bifidobacterium sp.]MCI1635256.1 hypothetical protein [Bifidobacterium sp.]